MPQRSELEKRVSDDLLFVSQKRKRMPLSGFEPTSVELHGTPGTFWRKLYWLSYSAVAMMTVNMEIRRNSIPSSVTWYIGKQEKNDSNLEPKKSRSVASHLVRVSLLYHPRQIMASLLWIQWCAYVQLFLKKHQDPYPRPCLNAWTLPSLNHFNQSLCPLGNWHSLW